MPVSRFAVFGHPIAHSLSPRIHTEFGRQMGVALDYLAFDVAPDAFRVSLEHFVAEGGYGANVTLPLKEAAFEVCTTLSARARRAGAVNTLSRVDGVWHGENTDGIGLVRNLTERHGLDLRGRRALLLGAGGAARGVAPALLDAGITEMVIVNRSPERADMLCDALGEPGRVSARYWGDLGDLGNFELIVNATSIGNTSDMRTFSLPRSLLDSMTVAVDLNYGSAAVPFLAWAHAVETRYAIDGLGMLVEQAAESFSLWHGRRPDTDPVYTVLHSEYGVPGRS
ncbi:shikimate dehydrogenase [Xylella fastidiosa subsp. multiplex]|uniref:Shikimate dehydrogenase (NADP(+)) n=2 Tax=Xylella fastidiosa TaxID=2371 RepID=AROE_XYLFM|nr:shikimate dehydrogenase [Xylella fastidiosa]B0U410.1 RecName: Full=Shikimate dehydrogenase (NADP(+)); Short=SDH [Xylella fastidiosa M12]ERI61050.1 shikimate 5-dehydrogenase [Xylella fastidiosa subsp. multiplex Griffin-1]ACA12589.1 shikimate 5-dehydrogenase [Xylella fastidiosa M12]KAJ4853216.1 shikimate dehydrogenase [Xylella fastidiosa subsp. multiplex]MBE0268282.1 shikimate dehydrogenase [Xylella fastidiosa subsp. multiplex]MBE0274785.1 shikimate dehydrogenase [Xylella fastidiosa subsp. m